MASLWTTYCIAQNSGEGNLINGMSFNNILPRQIQLNILIWLSMIYFMLPLISMALLKFFQATEKKPGLSDLVMKWQCDCMVFNQVRIYINDDKR